MSRDVIHVDGEDVTAREDTAKAFRGVNWAIVSIVGFVVITAAVFMFFFFGATARDGSVGSPAGSIQDERR